MVKRAKKQPDVYERYLHILDDECEEAYNFQRTLINGIHKRSYPHLVDDVIKVIKLDISKDQAYSDENLKTMLHNVGVLQSGTVMLSSAVRDAVSLLREGKYNGYVDKLIKTGEYERGGYSDPHWTGD